MRGKFLNNFKKYILILALFSSVFVMSNDTSYAQPECDRNSPQYTTILSCVYSANLLNFPNLDVRRTASNIATSLVTDNTYVIATGRDPDALEACVEDDLMRLQNGDQTVWTNPSCGFLGGGTYTSAGQPYAYDRGQGSMAGLTAYMGQVISQDDPIPTNLALFFRHQARNVPVIGNRVYAQATYGLPAEAFILNLWTISRNIAYGILTIVMIVIGGMIMFRKKVNPQAIVTVQNAIPRVIISVILITFSYAIGATAAALVFPLKNIGDSILLTANGSIAGALGGLGVMVEAIVIYVVGSFLTNGSFVTGIASLVLAVALMVFWLLILFVAFFKAWVVFYKILAMIVFAPVQFAIGTIPGNESMIRNWFKLLAARVITVPAMYFVISLAALVILQALGVGGTPIDFLPSRTPVIGWVGPVLNDFVTVLFIPSISMMILLASIRVPKKIENFVMGDPKGRRR